MPTSTVASHLFVFCLVFFKIRVKITFNSRETLKSFFLCIYPKWDTDLQSGWGGLLDRGSKEEGNNSGSIPRFTFLLVEAETELQLFFVYSILQCSHDSTKASPPTSAPTRTRPSSTSAPWPHHHVTYSPSSSTTTRANSTPSIKLNIKSY